LFVVHQVSRVFHPHVVGARIDPRHLPHLTGHGDGVLALDQQDGRPHGLPFVPEVPATPFLGDVAEGGDGAVQPVAVRAVLERAQEVTTGDRAEIVEHRGLVGERLRPCLDHGCPVRGGAAGEIGADVLHDQGTHPLGVPRGEDPAVQRAHRMPDHHHRLGDRGGGLGEIVDERLGGQLGGCGPAVTGGVEGTHLPVPA